MRRIATIIAALILSTPAFAASPPYMIYPSHGGVHGEPEFLSGYSLLWIDGAESLDLTKWKIENGLLSYAVVVRSNGKVGVHARLYPENPAKAVFIRLYQLGDDGKALGQPAIIIYDPVPLKR